MPRPTKPAEKAPETSPEAKAPEESQKEAPATTSKEKSGPKTTTYVVTQPNFSLKGKPQEVGSKVELTPKQAKSLVNKVRKAD